jgi:acyl carrier protein
MEPRAARQALTDLVAAHVAGVLAFSSASTVDVTRPFREIGFDSLTSVELRNRLSGVTGLALAPTVVFDFPTPRQLAEYLHDELRPAGESALTEVERLLTARADEPGLADLLRRVLDRLSPGQSGEDVLDTASDEEIFALIDGDSRKDNPMEADPRKAENGHRAATA